MLAFFFLPPSTSACYHALTLMFFVLAQNVLLHGVVDMRTRRAARQRERIDGGELTGCDEFDVKLSAIRLNCPGAVTFSTSLVHIRQESIGLPRNGHGRNVRHNATPEGQCQHGTSAISDGDLPKLWWMASVSAGHGKEFRDLRLT